MGKGNLALGLVTVLILAVGAACLPECNDRKTNTYDVYFYYPKSDSDDSEREEYLGQVKGISMCQALADQKASSLGMSRSDGWDYVCCWVTGGSSCKEKHR